MRGSLGKREKGKVKGRRGRRLYVGACCSLTKDFLCGLLMSTSSIHNRGTEISTHTRKIEYAPAVAGATAKAILHNRLVRCALYYDVHTRLESRVFYLHNSKY